MFMIVNMMCDLVYSLVCDSCVIETTPIPQIPEVFGAESVEIREWLDQFPFL